MGAAQLGHALFELQFSMPHNLQEKGLGNLQVEPGAGR